MAYCPHCLNPLLEVPASGPAPPTGMRCPHCRLVVAPGRAVDAETALARRTTGAASNVVGAAARREGADAIPEDEALSALTAAAQALGVSVRRLRMLDYDDLARTGRVTVPIGAVLATYGNWKDACRAAGDALGEEEQPA
jgi:hypothetical protein